MFLSNWGRHQPSRDRRPGRPLRVILPARPARLCPVPPSELPSFDPFFSRSRFSHPSDHSRFGASYSPLDHTRFPLASPPPRPPLLPLSSPPPVPIPGRALKIPPTSSRSPTLYAVTAAFGSPYFKPRPSRCRRCSHRLTCTVNAT